MKSYLDIVPKHLSAHKRKTRLTVISVVMAVTLVVGIFSILDSMVKFERAQVIKSGGNYHILLRNPSQQEIDFIRGRVDVKNSGSIKDLGEGTVNGKKCAFAAIDENFAENLNFVLSEGRYCTAYNEVLLEKWVTESFSPALKIGDTVSLSLPDGNVKDFIISGTYDDLGATKAVGIAGVILSMSASESITVKAHDFIILFKDGINIQKAESQIKRAITIPDSRIARNDALLALMLQTRHNRAQNIYAVGAILFFLVLAAAFVMIYNTFNISVMERVRQFGLLRCIGTSKAQIKRLVRLEGLTIAIRAIPIGVLMGIFLAIACSVLLKFYNPQLFGEIPLLSFSPLGVGSGVIAGFLTVYMASILPAKKAARVSPVNALTGSNEVKIRKERKYGLLTKLFRTEVAMGITLAASKKKTLFLMSGSIALTIIMFLGFNFLIAPEYTGTKSIRPYTPDISLSYGKGINEDTYRKLLSIEGIKQVYGRMASYVNATFDASRLTDKYKEKDKIIEIAGDGLLIASENSWVISYDKAQFKWAKEYLTAGVLDEDKLNAQNGIISVTRTVRNNVSVATVEMKLGDKVYIKTPKGTKVFTVMGILRSVPNYIGEEPAMATFVTTEKLLAEITSDTAYKSVDIKLENKNDEQALAAIKSIAGEQVTFQDRRQYNAEAKQAFLTVAVFIYGFIGVIAFISILNIINTMNTSVEAKKRYLGLMRAVGMSGSQLSVMVLTEASLYSLGGCIMGSILGVILRKVLTDFLQGEWQFPLIQLIMVFAFCMLTAVLSIISPLRRIKARGISETISSLQ